MVLGTILTGEEDLHTHLVFLDNIRRPIANALGVIASLQTNNAVIRKLEYLRVENEILKQKNRFENALIGIITSCGPVAADDNTCIIVVEPMGVIQYFSVGAQ